MTSIKKAEVEFSASPPFGLDSLEQNEMLVSARTSLATSVELDLSVTATKLDTLFKNITINLDREFIVPIEGFDGFCSNPSTMTLLHGKQLNSKGDDVGASEGDLIVIIGPATLLTKESTNPEIIQMTLLRCKQLNSKGGVWELSVGVN
ncbi:hypothetical protein T265_07385 [Opisthorchis viverrini]|uniref:Uncharacterized protein n=1 Tax=Opisthorchis viverrini TaxID=6198 RepID=A0A074ZHB5_OPIVI|nr:hypothetical protein T265_07385 [Opisthorchis viverrini]KER25097.1 hypothetical protein T265_07385 [Opisthorchis viverrini]